MPPLDISPYRIPPGVVPAEIIEFVKKKQFGEALKAAKANMASGLAVGIMVGLGTDLILDLQHQLALEMAYSTQVSQQTKTKNSAACVVKAMHSCLGKGVWTHNPSKKRKPMDSTPFEFLHKLSERVRNEQKAEMPNVFRVGARAPVRAWCREFEQMIVNIEDIVRENSRERSEQPERCRTSTWANVPTCIDREWTW